MVKITGGLDAGSYGYVDFVWKNQVINDFAAGLHQASRDMMDILEIKLLCGRTILTMDYNADNLTERVRDEGG